MKKKTKEFRIELRTVEQGGKTYILEEDVVKVSNKIAEMERSEPQESWVSQEYLDRTDYTDYPSVSVTYPNKKEEFIKRLHEVDERFSTMLAWEDSYKTGKSKVLMTPATEFYRLYEKEITSIQKENDRLKELLENIEKLSNLKTKEDEK